MNKENKIKKLEHRWANVDKHVTTAAWDRKLTDKINEIIEHLNEAFGQETMKKERKIWIDKKLDELDERLEVAHIRMSTAQTRNIKSFFRQTLISTINKIGLEEKSNEDFMKQLKAQHSDWTWGHSHGYNQAKTEIDKQKQHLINQLTK